MCTYFFVHHHYRGAATVQKARLEPVTIILSIMSKQQQDKGFILKEVFGRKKTTFILSTLTWDGLTSGWEPHHCHLFGNLLFLVDKFWFFPCILLNLIWVFVNLRFIKEWIPCLRIYRFIIKTCSCSHYYDHYGWSVWGPLITAPAASPSKKGLAWGNRPMQRRSKAPCATGPWLYHFATKHMDQGQI